jgi:glycosyltransferase involved in cell wall biosynthesis
MWERMTRKNEGAFTDYLVQAATIEFPVMSCIIPSWNSAETIERAVTSCLELPEVEVIVVDNGSKDTTVGLVESIADKGRVTLWQLPFDFGQGFARNLGVESAKGPLLFFLDSDDRMLRDGVEKAMSVLDSVAAGAVYGHRQQVNDPSGLNRWDTPSQLTPEVLQERVPLTPGMFIIRSGEFVKHNGWFHEGLLYSEDMEWLWNLVDKFWWQQVACALSEKTQGLCSAERMGRRAWVARQVKNVYITKFGLRRKR